jgi:hypothetical protein
VPPTILFAQDKERLSVANPRQPGVLAVAGDNPGRVGFVEDAPDGARADVGKEKLALVS